MIEQQVNLYQKQFHPVKEVMGVRDCLLLFGACICIFAIFSSMQYSKLASVEKELEATAQQHEMMMARLAKIADVTNTKRKTAVPEEDIVKVEKDLQSRRELLANLNSSRYGNTTGFSRYLQALARQHVEGSWITGLAVINGGNDISVAGSVLQPKLAPIYLQRLSKENIFSGKRFNVLELSRVESETSDDNTSNHSNEEGYIDFIIRTNKDDVMAVGEVGSGS